MSENTPKAIAKRFGIAAAILIPLGVVFYFIKQNADRQSASHASYQAVNQPSVTYEPQQKPQVAVVTSNQNRAEIKPSLRGTWYASVVSVDKGASLMPYNKPILTAYSTSVTMHEGPSAMLKNAQDTRTADGKNSTLMVFEGEGDICFAVTDTQNNGLYMLQIFKRSGGGMPEDVRYVFTIK